MAKIDFKKEWKSLYEPSASEFMLVEVPTLQFLMVDGHGDPNSAQEYQQAVEALYSVAYKLKFLSKGELGADYVVAPLEGLWWAQDWRSFTTQRDKSAWFWTMMIMQPEWITPDMVAAAVRQAGSGRERPALIGIRLAPYAEGLAVQILHIGSYEEEGPVLRELHEEVLPELRLEPAGKHHEIYLSDPRKVVPQKLRTVLRQPVRRVDGGAT